MKDSMREGHMGQTGQIILNLFFTILFTTLFMGFSQISLATDDIVFNLDAQGPDDVPNQSDISQSGFSDTHLVAPFDPYDSAYYDVSWTFDDTDRTGANSADACAFFDSDDAGGFADFAMCASFQENDAQTGLELVEVKLFDCKNSEPKPDEGARCPFTGGGGDGSNGVIASGTAPFADPNIGTLNNNPNYDSFCVLNVNVPDPFAGVPGREGEQNPFLDDEVECIVFVDEMVELDTDMPSGIELSNVCSFTSLDPNSERKDCIDIPSTLTIVKQLDNGADDIFNFNLSEQPDPITITTVNGEGTSGVLTLSEGAYNLTEDLTGNDEWELLSAVCVNDDDEVTDLLSTNGELTLDSKESEVCTFTNSLIPDPMIKIVKTGIKLDAGDGDDAGDRFKYDFTVTNIGNVTLNPVSVADPLINNQSDQNVVSIDCFTDPATDPVMLAPNPDNPNTPPYLDGDSANCTATYLLTQTDLDDNGNGVPPDGKIYNTATASGTDPDNTVVTDMDDHMIPIEQTPLMSVVKLSVTKSLNDVVPKIVTYDYTVSNDGNVTLTGVGIDDDNDNDDASCTSNTIAVGGSTSCTATHTFTQAELDANGSPTADSGVLFNKVTAFSNEAPDAFDDLSIPIISIFLTKELKNFTNVDGSVDTNNDPTITLGDILFYKFTVTNTGNLELTPSGTVFVEDLTFALTVTCNAAVLAPGASTDCETTNGHEVTLAEANAGQVFNEAIARGKDEFGLIVTHTTPVVITPVDADPSIEIVKSTNGVSASDPTAGDAPIIAIGGQVNWTYKVTNTGNVTISDIDVTDDQGVSVTCPGTTLEPDEMMTCIASGTADNLLTTSFTTMQGLCGIHPMTPLYENTGTATGTVTNGTLEPDNDLSHYCNPQIAELTLLKTVIKDNGGIALDTDFTLTATGPTISSGVEGDSSITDATVVIGNYVLSESSVSNYTYESLSCANATAGGTDVSGVSKASPDLLLYTTDDVTCTFTNSDDAPKLTLVKVVENGANPGGTALANDWTLTATGPTGFSGMTGVMSNASFDQGSYDLSESGPDGYVASDWVCSGGQVDGDTVSVGLGDDITCTITNTAKGMVMVNKTSSGQPAAGFNFEIRQGASISAEGNVLASDTTDANGEADFGGLKLVPGTYQLCETGMMPGWSNTIDGFTPLGATPEGGDNSTECIDFELSVGETEVFNVNNIPPPEGDARTIGFWKNWTSCDGHGNQDAVLDANLSVTLGLGIQNSIYVVDTCPIAVDLLDKRKVKNEDVVRDGKKSAGDPIYNMVAQLVAAKLNINATAGTCQALIDAIDAADALLDEVGFDGNQTYKPKGKNKGAMVAGIEEANYLGGILDAYNNNVLCN